MSHPAAADIRADAPCATTKSRTFKTPVPWGFIPGPAFLESVGGALAAVDLWLRHTVDDHAAAPERLMMIDLRERLAAVPQDPTAFQVQEAMAAIKTMADFASRRKVVRLSDTTTT